MKPRKSLQAKASRQVWKRWLGCHKWVEVTAGKYCGWWQSCAKKKNPAEEVLKHSFASLSSVSFSLLQWSHCFKIIYDIVVCHREVSYLLLVGAWTGKAEMIIHFVPYSFITSDWSSRSKEQAEMDFASWESLLIVNVGTASKSVGITSLGCDHCYLNYEERNVGCLYCRGGNVAKTSSYFLFKKKKSTLS